MTRAKGKAKREQMNKQPEHTFRDITCPACLDDDEPSPYCVFSILCPANCGCGNAVHSVYDCTACGKRFDGERSDGTGHSHEDGSLLCRACEAQYQFEEKLREERERKPVIHLKDDSTPSGTLCKHFHLHDAISEYKTTDDFQEHIHFDTAGMCDACRELSIGAHVLRDVMPEIAAEPVWLEMNQRKLHEAIGIAIIAATNHDAFITWYNAMQLKHGWHANQWDGDKMMGEAKVLVRDCGRTWKECKTVYDKKMAEMIKMKTRWK